MSAGKIPIRILQRRADGDSNEAFHAKSRCGIATAITQTILPAARLTEGILAKMESPNWLCSQLLRTSSSAFEIVVKDEKHIIP